MRSLVLIAALLACGSDAVLAQSHRRANDRKGLWFGFGLGTGTAGLDCSSCGTDRFSGPSGYVRVGGTLSRSVLLGFESNGWLHSEGGTDESIAFGSLVALWYPSATGALYLKVGFGGMAYNADDGVDQLKATAPSASIGIGYEFRVGHNVSVVPYLNTLASSAVRLKLNGTVVPTGEDISINLFQVGLGLTWH